MILYNIYWFLDAFTKYNLRMTNNKTTGVVVPHSISSASGSTYKVTGSGNPGSFNQICIAFGSGTTPPS